MNPTRFLAILALATAGHCYADLTIMQKVVSPSPSGGQAHQSSVSQRVKSTKMRMDIDQMTSMLIDLEAGTIHMLDHGGKKIISMPLDALKRQAEQMQAFLPDSQKKGEPSITATGKSETIGGLACKEYRVIGAGNMKMNATYWMAEDAKVAELDPFKKFIGDMSPMLGQDVFSKLKGLPMRSTSTLQMGGQSIESTTEVIRFSNDSLSEDVFVLPSDYTTETLRLQDSPQDTSGSKAPAARSF